MNVEEALCVLADNFDKIRKYDVQYKIENETLKADVRFSIVHNVEDIDSAFHIWIDRTEEHTAESLVDYINSKAYMTLQAAMTHENWEIFADE